MAKATQYKVEGVLKEKPSNLPKELTITEIVTDVPLDVTAKSVYGTEFRVTEYWNTDSALLKLGIIDNRSTPKIQTEKLLDRANTIKLRDALTELIGDAPQRLRVLHDASDGPLSDWRWYEMENGLFLYSRTVPEGHEKGDSTLEYIRDTFGIRSATYR